MKHGSFKDVGVVLFNMTSYGDSHILNGVVDAAREHGYATTIRSFEQGCPATLQSAIDQMKTLPVDGVVFILEQQVADFNTFVPSVELPVVLVSEEPSDHCPTIDSDQYGTSVVLVDYLLAKGHRNVYHIAGPSYSVAAQSRRRGWEDALRQQGIVPPSVYIGDWEADSGIRPVWHWRMNATARRCMRRMTDGVRLHPRFARGRQARAGGCECRGRGRFAAGHCSPA